LNDPPVSQDTSYGSALQEGTHDALGGLGSTLGVLSGDVGWKGGQSAGNYLQNAVPAPANYSSAGGDMVSKLKAGQLLGALKDLPRAAVEGAPAVLGGLGAAAATPEVLGGAAVGAGAYGALSAFGQDAQARAAANGHAQPTAGDQLAAAPTALAQGGLNAVGLGKVPSGLSALLAKSPAVLRGLAMGGVDAAGQAASNVVGQAGTTAGTKQGLTVDPDQAAAAALQALAARAGGKIASQTAGAAGSGVTSAVRSIGVGLAASDLPKMSDEQAASYARINAAYDAQDPARSDANPTTRMNALAKQQKAQLGQVIAAAESTGQVDDDTAATLKTALQQAGVHKSALDTNLLTKLNSSRVDPQLAQTLRNGLTDLDNLSQMVNYKQASGPFAAIGAKIATPVAALGLMTAGHPVDAGLVALGLGHTGIVGRVGGVVGNQLDRLAGTNLPPSLVLRAQAANQAQAAGIDTSGGAIAPLSDAYSMLDGIRARQAADTLAQQAAAEERARSLQETAANQVSGMAYRNSEDGIVARARLAAQRAEIIAQAKADGRIPAPMTQDQRDRVMMGLSPSDPIPTNVPLGAGNVPLVQTASGTPPVPRPVAPLGLPPVPPQAAPGGAPQAASALPVGWLTHLHTALSNAGLPATQDVIGKALGGAVAKGRIGQDFAEWLLANPGQFVGDRSVPFQHLVAQAQENAGMTPNPVVAPVQSPPKYAAAVQTYQTLGNTLQNEAQAAGDMGLKIAIARIMATSSAQQKVDIANHELAQRSHDAVALARAKQLLPPELFRG
jgi:hypothetical protein